MHDSIEDYLISLNIAISQAEILGEKIPDLEKIEFNIGDLLGSINLSFSLITDIAPNLTTKIQKECSKIDRLFMKYYSLFKDQERCQVLKEAKRKFDRDGCDVPPDLEMVFALQNEVSDLLSDLQLVKIKYDQTQDNISKAQSNNKEATTEVEESKEERRFKEYCKLAEKIDPKKIKAIVFTIYEYEDEKDKKKDKKYKIGIKLPGKKGKPPSEFELKDTPRFPYNENNSIKNKGNYLGLIYKDKTPSTQFKLLCKAAGKSDDYDFNKAEQTKLNKYLNHIFHTNYKYISQKRGEYIAHFNLKYKKV